jgi:hypothetical protein
MKNNIGRATGITIAYVLCLLLLGCAHAVPKERIAAMKRVGVVSFLGDAIEFSEERLLPLPGVFSAEPFQVSSWQMDRYVRELITKEMARHAAMKIIAFDYDQQALWKANYNGPSMRSEELRPVVLFDLYKIARSHDLDTLIVVYGPRGRALGEPYQFLPFCVYRSYGIIGRNVDYFTLVWISVLDVKSTETLASWAFHDKESLDASFWPPFTEAGALTALEKKTKDVLAQRIPPIIKKLGF